MPKITPFLFEEKIESFIRRYRLVNAGEKILVAVSGGPDSMCLLTVLSRLGYPVHAAHVNYMLREEESLGDELFVEDWCKKQNIPVHLNRTDTKALLISSKKGLQELARDLRYTWFDQLMEEHNIHYTATGHHLGDQAETVLFNLIRGAGLTGAQGIQVDSERINLHRRLIRPLLGTSREEILDYLSLLSISFRTDRTNLNTDYTRNKIRHDILPSLEKIKSGATLHISEFAQRMQDIQPVFKLWIDELKKKSTTIHDHWIEIIYQPHWNSGLMYLLVSDYGFNPDQALLITDHLRVHHKGKIFYAPRYVLATAENSIQITTRDKLKPFEEVIPQLPFEFNYANKSFTITRVGYPSLPSDSCVALDHQKIKWPLTIRTWRAGDRMLPLGMQGKSKKIKDMLTDKKISGFEKKLALVLESSGQIICLLNGLHTAEMMKADATTKDFLRIEVLEV
ncbi:MAG: tRNA lysidine(34) synthetase TilS [Saprospiraceae bacterium]|nr:tRNA lysidine(34) synthetase TilS [Saprospiraceae bacterium]